MEVIKYLTVLLLIFLYQDSFAQITIDGTVTDADLNPVSDALVEIIDEDDSTNVYSANTNEQGYFSISAITDIEEDLSQVPQNYIVLSNYPNPFNPSTAIYFELPKADDIEIVIYDILGREIRVLYKAFHEAGSDQIIWDGRNNRNSPVAAGIYLCRLKTKDMFKVHKMVLLDGGSSSPFLA
ncbi:MAG: T9SS type A sorting domain-containing protein [Ignavibacteriaceae bacterium]